MTGDPDDVKPACNLEDEVIDNEIEDIIGTLHIAMVIMWSYLYLLQLKHVL